MGLVAKRVHPQLGPAKGRHQVGEPGVQAYERIAEEVNVVGRVVLAARRL